MHGNNETGVLQPVREIAEIAAEREVFFHVDGAQTFGKEVDTMRTLTRDFLAISAHKVYGPKGVGALYVRKRSGRKRELMPIVFGGGQERGLRPGTIPVPLVVGLGRAAELAAEEHRERRASAARVKERFLKRLASTDHYVNGDVGRAQTHVVNVSFPGVDSEALMMATREEIAISNGSACTSSDYRPSHVLRAMGLDDDRIESAVRISWGPGVEEIPVASIVEAVDTLRG
jgi:cysteine desulfurase